ncbi:nucleotidyltransferase [Streptomyces sp. ISL-11]|uniref:nucleotidyltransferase domain-containing protein n=1 Tax=Streptomyces sp. ISL-11 TaxID=2819174 RepID=UPI001BE77B4B|nr:nucleotidyltransferase [Streptomyces sp. ISL-11]MBT2382395.1 nucleotidyltransferase [Streptomyces sp. ISL-11]
MPRSVPEGFDVFLSRLVPLASQREAAAKHRSRVESSLSNALGIHLFREIGSSFSHGTGVRDHCDVDLLVSIKGERPNSPDTALGRVKSALQTSFPYTEVAIRKPTVVVKFAQGMETWEVLPGFITSRGSQNMPVYDIPGAAGGWMDTAPTAHLAYVNEINNLPGIAGGAKKLARLAKAWKYYNEVPMSSFYLEMRAARYMSTQSPFVPVWDVCGFFEHLHSIQLAAMNDPKGNAGRFSAYSAPAEGAEALSKLANAASRARRALAAHNSSDAATAFHNLDLLFGGEIPLTLTSTTSLRATDPGFFTSCSSRCQPGRREATRRQATRLQYCDHHPAGRHICVLPLTS